MSFRTGGIAVLAAVSLKSQTALTAKVAQLKKKIMDKHYSLALLVQELYVDRYPVLYKPSLSLYVSNGRMHLISVTRPFDKLQTIIPLLILTSILIACLWAVFITIGTESIRPTMDIRIWAWFFLIVLTSCGICIYYLWLVKGRQPSIFWGNEMLQLELDLKKCECYLVKIITSR